MPISVIIFTVIVFVFAFRGYRKGSWRALTGLIGLVLAYWLSFAFAPVAAPWVELNTTLRGLLALSAAGAGIFVAVVMAIKILAWLVNIIFKALVKVDREGDGLSLLSRLGGTLVNSAVGVVFALALVYVYGVGAPLLQEKVQLGFDAVESEPSVVTVWANRAAAFVTREAMAVAEVEPSVAKASAAAMAAPIKTAQSLQDLSKNVELKQLFQDPEQRQLLAAGDLDQVIGLPAFQSVAASDEMQQLAEIAGIEAGAETDEYQQQLAEKMSRAAKKMDTMRDDPRLQQILNDPELQRQLNGGNPLQLLNNPNLKEIAGIFLNDQ